MTFTFRPAVRENEPIRLGIAGPSRSGKSMSALLIAKGMAGGDLSKVFGIDTERPGLTFYADKFPGFRVARLEAPFSPARYREGIQAAAAAGAVVTIIDSASHEHEGDGGVLMMQEAEMKRMAGDDYAKREKVKFAAWIKPKAEHNALVQDVLQLNMHTIWCFRAKEKLKLLRVNGKIEPTPQGWQPIITSGFEFEMTSLIVLGLGARGVPDLDAQASSFREPLDAMVERGKPLGEDLGRQLAAWAAGKPAEPAKPQERDWFKFGTTMTERVSAIESVTSLETLMQRNAAHLVGYEQWNHEKWAALLALVAQRKTELLNKEVV